MSSFPDHLRRGPRTNPRRWGSRDHRSQSSPKAGAALWEALLLLGDVMNLSPYGHPPLRPKPRAKDAER
jgi:hypothetical protein